MAKAGNIGNAKPNPTSGDVQGKAKQTYVPLGYKKEIGGGKAERGERGQQMHFSTNPARSKKNNPYSK